MGNDKPLLELHLGVSVHAVCLVSGVGDAECRLGLPVVADCVRKTTAPFPHLNHQVRRRQSLFGLPPPHASRFIGVDGTFNMEFRLTLPQQGRRHMSRGEGVEMPKLVADRVIPLQCEKAHTFFPAVHCVYRADLRGNEPGRLGLPLSSPKP